MKKIFLQFGSGLGPMSRTLPIAAALSNEGYELKYFGAENAKTYMEKCGIQEISQSFNIRDIKKGVQNPDWNCAEEFWGMIGYGNIEWVESKVLELIEYIKEFSPDYIFSDLGILACIAARIMKIPLIAMNQSCYHPNNAYGHLKWWTNIVDEDYGITYKLNSLLKKYGATQINKFEEIFTGCLTIIPSFPEFDPIDSLGEYNTHYIGPVLWDPIEIADNNTIKLFEKINGKPTIFCYTARFYDNVGESGKVIFESMIDALQNIDANIIFSTGSEVDRRDALTILEKKSIKSSDLKIIDWVPMGIAYGSSDLVIHHGGHGSCLGQFLYKVPSLVMPTHAEREYNARICNKLGISEFLLRSELNKGNIISKITKLLSDSDYYLNINKWHGKVADQINNLSKVVELINKL